MRIAGFLLAVLSVSAAAHAQQTLTLEIRDFATMPISGLPLGKTSNEMLLARVNAIREEPGGADRLFVADMNGPLYILDKNTKQFIKYLDFDGRDDRPGMFHRFFITSGYGNGLNGFHFDPDYRRTGKFYTVHMEDPNLTASNLPDNKNQAGLNLERLLGDADDRHSGRHDQRGRAHRMDRHEHVEYVVRRHGPRADARPTEHPQSSYG